MNAGSAKSNSPDKTKSNSPEGKRERNSETASVNDFSPTSKYSDRVGLLSGKWLKSKNSGENPIRTSTVKSANFDPETGLLKKQPDISEVYIDANKGLCLFPCTSLRNEGIKWFGFGIGWAFIILPPVILFIVLAKLTLDNEP